MLANVWRAVLSKPTLEPFPTRDITRNEEKEAAEFEDIHVHAGSNPSHLKFRIHHGISFYPSHTMHTSRRY